MALIGDQLKPTLRANLSAALKHRAPPSGKADWQERKADRVGVSLTTFQSWYYGNEASAAGSSPASLPSFENWVALCAEFPGLHDEVVGDIVGEYDTAATLREIEADAQALAEKARALRQPMLAVPLDGKLS